MHKANGYFPRFINPGYLQMCTMYIHRVIMGTGCIATVYDNLTPATGKMKTISESCNDPSAFRPGCNNNFPQCYIFRKLGNNAQTMHIMHFHII